MRKTIEKKARNYSKANPERSVSPGDISKFSGHLWCFHCRQGPETLVVRFPRSWRGPWEEASLASCDRRLTALSLVCAFPAQPPVFQHPHPGLWVCPMHSGLWGDRSHGTPSALTKQLTVTFCFPFDVEGRLTRDTFIKQDRDNARSSFLVTSFLNSHKGLVENNPRLDAPRVVPHKFLECSRRCWLSTRSWLTRINTDVFPENRHKPNCQIETLPLCWEGTPPFQSFTSSQNSQWSWETDWGKNRHYKISWLAPGDTSSQGKFRSSEYGHPQRRI